MEQINKKELAILVDFLERAADEWANNTCNDWSFPSNWTKEEKINFVRQYHEYNGDPEEFNENRLHVPDFGVIRMLCEKLKKLSNDSL